MKKLSSSIILIIGWTLSPFTWWNDAFINIPLSYLLANAVHIVVPLPFKWLVIGAYWFTNALGIFLLYFGGKGFTAGAGKKARTLFFLVLILVLYSLAILYLDRCGKLSPIITRAE